MPRKRTSKAAAVGESTAKKQKSENIAEIPVTHEDTVTPGTSSHSLFPVHAPSIETPGHAEEGAPKSRILWSTTLTSPVFNLVSYHGYVYGRFGGDDHKWGVWRLKVPGM